MKRKVKITILKREFYGDLVEKYIAKPGVDRFPYENNFCISAWDILKGKVYSALQGGNFYWEGWMKDSKKIVVCCDDGVRPVVFLMEVFEE